MHGRIVALLVAVLVVIPILHQTEANPLGKYLSPAATTHLFGVCIRNCAQCKKMFGPYFEGQLCADACIKFKGKMIPDCEDVVSISPFLNKLE